MPRRDYGRGQPLGASGGPDDAWKLPSKALLIPRPAWRRAEESQREQGESKEEEERERMRNGEWAREPEKRGAGQRCLVAGRAETEQEGQARAEAEKERQRQRDTETQRQRQRQKEREGQRQRKIEAEIAETEAERQRQEEKVRDRREERGWGHSSGQGLSVVRRRWAPGWWAFLKPRGRRRGPGLGCEHVRRCPGWVSGAPGHSWSAHRSALST